MIAVIQRVSEARVEVSGECVGKIDRGIAALVAVEKGDGDRQVKRMAERLLSYRVFPDPEGKMNLDLRQINGGLLLVPQFTLAADTRKGTRPSFGPAASPEVGEQLFDRLYQTLLAQHGIVGKGVFGADMQVTLTNDGPVTFWLTA